MGFIKTSSTLDFYKLVTRLRDDYHQVPRLLYKKEMVSKSHSCFCLVVSMLLSKGLFIIRRCKSVILCKHSVCKDQSSNLCQSGHYVTVTSCCYYRLQLTVEENIVKKPVGQRRWKTFEVPNLHWVSKVVYDKQTLMYLMIFYYCNRLFETT